MAKITTLRGSSASSNFGASDNNCGCGGGGNSMFPDSANKRIRFSCAKGKASLVINEGANTLATLDLCEWSESYEQFFNTSMFLAAGKEDVEINYGHLGTQITFIAIYVEYTRVYATTAQEKEIPNLTYTFETEPSVERPINDLFIHTGTKNARIPQIFLSNPNERWDARVHILASTEELTFDEVTKTFIGDDVITIGNLEYTSLKSDAQTLCILDDNDDAVLVILWDNISNLELNGKIITIDDNATGKVNLSFKTEFDACQAYSLLLWSMSDPTNNLISNPVADTLGPVITYNSSFETQLLLTDYPANGTNSLNGYLITKQDLIGLSINIVNDARDGQIYIDDSNITLKTVGEVEEINSIDSIGLYSFIIDVSDNACNTTTDSFILNVKDENPPQIILNDFGESIVNASTSGSTAGFNFNSQLENIWLEDYISNIITKQNLIDLAIESIWDARDGYITPHINNVTVNITSTTSNVLLNNISAIGDYNIRFQVSDSDSNVGEDFYSAINTALNANYLTLRISENFAPIITFNDISPLYLNTFPGNTITKDYLNSNGIDSVVDDRDGIITTNVLNIQIFKTGVLSATSGTNSIFVLDNTSGTAGAFFDVISDTEVLYVDEAGLYFMRVNVADTDSASSSGDNKFTVYD
jgi:hypothetical protein